MDLDLGPDPGLDPDLRSEDGLLADDPGGDGDSDDRRYGFISVVGVFGVWGVRGMMDVLRIGRWWLQVKGLVLDEEIDRCEQQLEPNVSQL